VQISTRTVNVINLGETSGWVAQQLNSAALSWCDDRGIRSSVVGRDKILFFHPKTGSGVHPACYQMIVEGGGGGGAFFGTGSIRDVNLSGLHQLMSSKYEWNYTVPPLRPYAFMAWL
jgi:hypothetical protein